MLLDLTFNIGWLFLSPQLCRLQLLSCPRAKKSQGQLCQTFCCTPSIATKKEINKEPWYIPNFTSNSRTFDLAFLYMACTAVVIHPTASNFLKNLPNDLGHGQKPSGQRQESSFFVLLCSWCSCLRMKLASVVPLWVIPSWSPQRRGEGGGGVTKVLAILEVVADDVWGKGYFSDPVDVHIYEQKISFFYHMSSFFNNCLASVTLLSSRNFFCS